MGGGRGGNIPTMPEQSREPSPTRPPEADRTADSWPDRDRNADGRPENARPRDRFGAPLPRGAVDEMPQRLDPAEVCTTVGQAVTAAHDLFDQRRFFEAHEYLEWAWKGPATDEADRPVFKALAQIAVGYTHTQRRNDVGARTLLQRGIDVVAGHPPVHGIDVAAIAADAERFLALLHTTEAGPDLDFPTWRVAKGTPNG